MTTTERDDVTRAWDMLRRLLPPSATIYQVRRTSAAADFYTYAEGELWYLTGYLALAGFGGRTKNGLTRFESGGALAYDLGQALHKDARALHTRII